MFKRIITLALAIVCLASFAIVGASALTADAEGEYVYTATLTTPELIEDVQGYVTYDPAVLEVVACETPNLGDSAIVNTEVAGTVYFNASVVKGIDFKAAATLVEIKFKAIGDGEATAAITIEEMTEKDGDSYYTNSEKKNDAVVLDEAMVGYVAPTTQATVPTTTVAPTEATTVAPTEATTAEATTLVPATDVQGSTATTPADGNDTPPTGSTVAMFAVLAVVAMAGAAVVVLRKKANA
ncbi:MAG: hypothetical protein IJZ54_08285 [Clostridia bacterium]|nr:hypothetical protein [Clostridia bacterium]